MAIGQYLGLIGGIVGAIVGGVIGTLCFPVLGTGAGVAWGFTIGSMIGGVAGQIFWPEQAELNLPPPPQPHETRLQFSSWGMPIPIQYGSGRLAGNIIYMSDIVETIDRSRHRQDGVRYYEMVRTYTATFAIAFCDSDPSAEGVARIWVNNKVFADFRFEADYPSGYTGLAYGNLDTTIARQEAYFKVYYGSATQEYDPIIASLIGAEETPAYKDVLMIVFYDFPIGEFSGVPQIEIETGTAYTGYILISLVGWAEVDLEYVSENPANFLTLASDGFTLSNAFNAFTSAYSYSDPYGSGSISRIRFKYELSGFSGSGSIALTLFWFQDATGYSYIKLALGINSVEFRLYKSSGYTSKTYSSVSFPFSRWVELDFTTADATISKIYTDSGFSVLEETLNSSGTGMAANPVFTFGQTAAIINDSSLNFSLTVSNLKKAIG